MTVAYETSARGWSSGSNTQSLLCLEDRYEIIKDIGDGSFGSVALGRTRSAGAQTVRRGTLVAIKTMKKTFESFAQCLELREVIFMRSLPSHVHLVPAYDIFLDPLSKKLHIAMEYMDGNLYQLMKARDHKYLDGSSVKSILFQIMSGLEHIHDHHFFHRDIKPENILVSTSAPEANGAFKRYSALVTPPSTPPTYTIKIADFGLARETHSRLPYTTYVSTRWYRAPEVLLRAVEYSAPVDIWAVGAMAVEIATLKPLFPGGNEVDQVWRVCEIMGSPGAWVDKLGNKVGGGEWRDGVRLAQKLGFAFPKMAPHALDTILPAPTWPASLANFVTWCLMWDPKVRPTSRQALEHEYFADAVDPLIRPKTGNTARALGRKGSVTTALQERSDSSHSLSTKTSAWFRKSLGARESAPILPSALGSDMESQQSSPPEPAPRPLPVPSHSANPLPALPVATKPRAAAPKRATWNNGPSSTNAAPIPILPSIRPVSPIPNTVNAQAIPRVESTEKTSKKIGRQLSVNSQGNHYAEMHRAEAERALTGANGLKSPTASHRESFFSHLRKRARRLSGRHAPATPGMEDSEASAGCAPWAANNNNNNGSYRQSIQEHQTITPFPATSSKVPHFADLDRALQSVRYSLDATAASAAHPVHAAPKVPSRVSSNPTLKRHHSLPNTAEANNTARTRRSLRPTDPSNKYETPDEEDELLDEAIASARRAAHKLDHMDTSHQQSRPAMAHVASDPMPYLTPSPSKDRNGVSFGAHDYTPSKPMDIPPAPPAKDNINPQWPTPPYDDNDWAAQVANSIFATQASYR